MIRTVREPHGTLELCLRETLERHAQDAGTESFVVQRVRRFARGPLRDQELRALLDARPRARLLSRLTEDEVIVEVARLVVCGELILRHRTPPALSARDLEVDEDVPASARRPAPAEVTTWVEIELVEHDGTPVGREPYFVITDGGRIVEGSLDGRGFARVEGVAPGTCTVVFPRRDRTDWEGAEVVLPEDRGEPPARTWIEIELVEADGTPVANEPFLVFDGDREIARGRLDDAGLARVKGAPKSGCSVVFPLRHATDVEPLD